MREMKNSGIEWIGEIPRKWSTDRLQWHLEEIKIQNSPLQSEQVLSLTIEAGIIPYEYKGNQGNKAKENYEEYKLAYQNTLVVNSMNVIIGAVGISNYFGCVSPVYYVFKTTPNTDLRYIYYLFTNIGFQKEMRKYAKGILEIRLRISSTDMLKRIIPNPSYDEQKRIADFLGRKCAEIDTVIEKTKATIEEYKKLKQSIITETVTKGIHGNRPMKDSGIEWIGDIPSEWKIARLKSLFSFGKGLPITKENLVETGVSVISYGQIHSKLNTGIDIRPDLIRYVSENYLSTNNNSLVHYGDFIFADTSEDLDGCGNNVYVNNEELLFAGYHTIILCNREKNDNSFLVYLFKTDGWRSQIRSKVSGVKLFSISKKILAETTVLLPDKYEQSEIVKYLNTKCSEIDKIIEQKTHLLSEMENLKKSVIYEYVTGKKEVV